MEILGDYVDKFVIVEATETFVGKSKPLYFKENRMRYWKWADKIVHYVVDDFPDNKELFEKAMTSPNTGAKEHFWIREFYQKESMIYALSFCKDDDLVFISDLDEIWNPKLKYDTNATYRPKQTAYHYYLNNRSNQDIGGWVGTRCGSYKRIKEVGINHFRTESFNPSIMLENGGWHFSNLGNFDFIKNKMESYSHQEFNNEQIKSKIEEHIKNNTDFLHRGFSLWKDESDLPEYILNNKTKWQHLLLA